MAATTLTNYANDTVVIASNTSNNLQGKETYNYGDRVTITGTTTRYPSSIYNYGANASIYAEDYIGVGNNGSNTTINADAVSNFADNVLINAIGYEAIINEYINLPDWKTSNITNGNYSVQGGANVTINGSAKGDNIYNYGESALLNGGAGNDNIFTYRKSNVTLIGEDGDDDIWNTGGQNITMYGGDGDDRLVNCDINSEENPKYSDNILMIGGSGKDTLSNSSKRTTINAGLGNDEVENYGADVSIDGGEGNDTINNAVGGDNVFIYGGEGSDSILNADRYTHRYYGSTVDTDSSGKNITINGGAGDDTIVGSTAQGYGEYILFSESDGNDVIVNYGSDDTIHLISGQVDRVETIGTDIVAHIGSGSLTFKNLIQVSRVAST